MTITLRQIGGSVYATADGRYRIDKRRGGGRLPGYYISDSERAATRGFIRAFARVDSKDLIPRAIDDYLTMRATAALTGRPGRKSVRVYRSRGRARA